MFDPVYVPSAEHLVLGEGMLLADLNLDAALSAADPLEAIADAIVAEDLLLGRTRPGGVFQATPDLVDLEAGAHRTPMEGMTVLAGWKAILEGVLTDISAHNVQRALPGADLQQSTNGKLTTLTLRPHPKVPEGPGTLCWIGTAARGLLAIELKRPLSKSLTLRFTGDEAEMPYCFQARSADASESPQPFRLLWWKEDANA